MLQGLKKEGGESNPVTKRTHHDFLERELREAGEIAEILPIPDDLGPKSTAFTRRTVNN